MENKTLALVLTIVLFTSMFLGVMSTVRADILEVGPGKPYSTIQAAIDAASPGDTIIVHDGTYDEQVVIDKSLVIQGYGDTTIVKPSSAAILTQVFGGLFWYGTPNTKQIAGIIVANVPDGSNVTIKNLKVDESSVTTKPAGADYLAGIFYRETGGTIDTVNIVGAGAWSGSDRAYGIYLSAATNTASVQITGSTITNYDKNGIEAMGNKLTFNIHNNVLTGRGPVGDEVQNGINVGRGSVGTVNNNTISNLVYQPETYWSASIMFYDYVINEYGSGSVAGNTITDCQIGVIFINCNSSAQGNTVNGGTVGLLGLSSEPEKGGTWTASFVNNTVGGVKDSPGYENSAIDAQTFNAGASLTVTIQNNTLTGGGSTDADGVYIDGDAGSVTATISDNIISGWNYGINLASACVSGATITGNNITGTYLGIRMENVTGVQISDNRIIDFTKGGIVTRGAKNIFIEGNNISTTLHDEAPNGIDIGTWSGTTGIVRGNRISGCSWKDFTGGYETSWSGSGILVIESGDSLEITGNIVHECDVGMDIESDSMNITCNDVYNNIYGFVFWNAKPKVNYNNIYSNTQYGVYRAADGDLTGVLDACHNWWGDPTGPYHATLNPSGKGDAVSDNVNFEHWLLEPYPPLLYIDPAKVEYWTPSYNSVFKVDLKIANVTDLTCYEFKLYWNTTLLDFDYAYIVEIWPLQIKIENISESMGRYWLAVSAQGDQSFTGSATLVELYFKVKYDPIYPNNVYSLLNLNETVLGDTSEPTSQPIPHMVHDGEYWCYSTKPKMKVEPSPSTAKKLGQTFSINITVHDVVRMYDFEFWLYYDTTLLDIYSPYIQLGPMMSGATIYISGYDDVLGYVHFAAKLTSPAPPVNGSGTVAIVTFKVTKASIWPEPDLECALSLDSTKLKTIGGIEVPHDKINGLYRYKPIIGDLTTDGTVDLDDFYIIALAFGSKPGESNWNKYADLDRSGVVNVLDLRTAARHFGEDC